MSEGKIKGISEEGVEVWGQKTFPLKYLSSDLQATVEDIKKDGEKILKDEEKKSKMSEEIKRMDIKEFKALGYLQELNRQLLHPLGLAMEVIIDEKTGEEKLGGVWDYRDDPEGMYYGLNNPKYTSKERLASFKKKAEFVISEEINRMKVRQEKLGFHIEPIPEEIQITPKVINEEELLNIKSKEV